MTKTIGLSKKVLNTAKRTVKTALKRPSTYGCVVLGCALQPNKTPLNMATCAVGTVALCSAAVLVREEACKLVIRKFVPQTTTTIKIHSIEEV